jgi:hypothetical protein
MNSPNAGWYKDPNGNPCERLWDGENWTDKTRPLQTADYQPKAKGKGGPILGFVIVSIILVVGIFMFYGYLNSELEDASQEGYDIVEQMYVSDEELQQLEDFVNEYDRQNN